MLIIESRAVPDLELASFIARRQVCGLGKESLRFSPQEVCALAQIQNVPNFSEEEAIQIATTFDGWIAGMLLASRFGATSFEAFPFVPEGTHITPFIDRKHLLAFVVSEVFGDEAPIYTFLKETSFLDPLVPVFCDALLNTSNAAELLEQAERQGLFVTCTLEAGKRLYHYQPSLRQLFQEELCQHEPETARALHRRIACLYSQTYDYQSALTHALAAQADDLIMEILLEGSTSLLKQGQSELVLRGVDSLSPQTLENAPRLLLIQINTYLRRGDAARARSCFDQSSRLVALLAQSEQPLIRAELALAQGKLFLQQGAHLLAQKNFQEALVWLPIDERELRLLAHQQCGICSMVSGQPVHEGIAHFQQALQLYHVQHDVELAGELHHQLATAYMWAGNYILAEHHRQYLRVLQDQYGQPQKIINNLIGLGLLKLRQGLLEEAETAFQSILNLTQHTPRFLSSYAYALVGSGELALLRSGIPQALGYLQEALDIARRLGDRYLLNDTLGMLALTYLRLNERYTAQSLLDQMVVQEQETHSYESVSRQLVQGTLLLAEERYEEASAILEQVVGFTGESGIQWLHMQALLRLAACRVMQRQPGFAQAVVQKVNLFNAGDTHAFCIQEELQTYPYLLPLMQEEQRSKEHTELSVLPAERLRIYALGEPAVVLDGRPVTSWGRARALELFFFLLESKEPLHKNRIIAALWPEAEEGKILNQAFRSTVYCIRQALGESSLTYQANLYKLQIQAVYGQVWYDVALFEEQRLTAQAALEEDDDQKAEQAYQNMIELYRGKYAEAMYSDWCNVRRDELHQSLMEARRQLALITWRRESWEESLQHWQHLVTLDPCLETAHYGIMRCYARQGKRDLALRQYQRSCRILYEQLGVEPGPPIQKLYQRLVSPQG
ncbi:hypothetical protein KSC_006370 [Ktedonobacter sp. SOSP1-52]|nr:hypothetical protein KSC_006370 [Ktedonobacter sp. SOSP1-52]